LPDQWNSRISGSVRSFSCFFVLGQMPVKEWHAFINDPALADAILDRLVHSSVKITLKGESMRKLKSDLQ